MDCITLNVQFICTGNFDERRRETLMNLTPTCINKISTFIILIYSASLYNLGLFDFVKIMDLPVKISCFMRIKIKRIHIVISYSDMI